MQFQYNNKTVKINLYIFIKNKNIYYKIIFNIFFLKNKKENK